MTGVAADKPRLVGVGSTFVATTATTVDLGAVFLGRPDAMPSPLRSTVFVVDLDGLDAPSPTDLINVYSSDLTVFIEHELGDVATLSRSYHAPFLIEEAKGDVVWIAQLATRRSANDILYDFMIDPTKLGMPEAGSALITSRFTP